MARPEDIPRCKLVQPPHSEHHANGSTSPAPEKAVESATTAAHDFPEGGARAWLVVLGAWATMFFTFGYVNAFGIYEAYYLTTLDESASTIAWIGSFQFFALFSAGSIAGPLTDRFGPSIILWPCATLFVASVMITSVCKEYYQFMLAQGVLGGIACGLIYSPAVSVVGHYFHRRRPLAIAVASSGSSLGGIIFPIILERLLYSSSVGFGWTVRIIGFLILGLCLVACLTIKTRLSSRKGPHFLPEAFSSPVYSLQVAGLFFVFWGVFVPMFFLPDYAQSKGMSRTLAWYTISTLNAGSFFGRLGAGFLSSYLNVFDILAFACGACGILIFCWLRITSNAAIIIFSVLFGIFSGVVVGTFVTTIAHAAPHPSKIGTYIGMALGILGLSGLTGAPIAGALISRYGEYTQAMYFGGSMTLAGTALIVCARISHLLKRA